MTGILRRGDVDRILGKFIKDFVTCRSCKKPCTKLVKDKVTRLQFMICNECGSQWTTPHIKTFFHATTRSDRKKERTC